MKAKRKGTRRAASAEELVKNRRLICACIGIAVCVAAIGVVGTATSHAVLLQQAVGGQVADADSALVSDADGVPVWFADSFDTDASRLDMRVDETGTVVGFTYLGTAQDCIAELRPQLEAHGWSCVDSGVAGCMTCVRSEGACRWLVVSCTDIGEVAAVVVQTAAEQNRN